MNLLFEAKVFNTKDTEKYVKICCVNGCIWEAWFHFEDCDPASQKRFNLKYFRSIYFNHRLEPHQNHSE